jgi:hypothetical protein
MLPKAPLGAIKAILMNAPDDLYNPTSEAAEDAKHISGAEYILIPSLQGHFAGSSAKPADVEFMNKTISTFLNRVTDGGKASIGGALGFQVALGQRRRSGEPGNARQHALSLFHLGRNDSLRLAHSAPAFATPPVRRPGDRNRGEIGKLYLPQMHKRIPRQAPFVAFAGARVIENAPGEYLLRWLQICGAQHSGA